MPLKPNEETPRTDVKMPEETRKAVYGKSEKESDTGSSDEARNREHKASESGSPDSKGSDKRS
ncbi:hypothetical protein ACLESO_39015 [Pyxidicoccus sp. 3LG]